MGSLCVRRRVDVSDKRDDLSPRSTGGTHAHRSRAAVMWANGDFEAADARPWDLLRDAHGLGLVGGVDRIKPAGNACALTSGHRRCGTVLERWRRQSERNHGRRQFAS